jgi:hypothetical protein
MTFLPSRTEKICRRAFIKVMEMVIEHPDDADSWKKFFLLPVALFTDIKGNRRAAMIDRINDVLRDDWSNMRLKMFSERRLSNRNSTSDSVKRQVDRLATAGEIGSVMKLLQQDQEKVQVNATTMQKLPMPIGRTSPPDLGRATNSLSRSAV